MRFSEQTDKLIPALASIQNRVEVKKNKTNPGGKKANQFTYKSNKERIEKNIRVDGDCWIWTGFIDELGYGRTRVQGRVFKAHRLSYEVYKDDLKGLCVLHRCDVRSCVNPEHLFLGTQVDNIKDMVSKKRHRNVPKLGEENPMSKYSSETVKKVRAEYEKGLLSQKKIGLLFGMSTMNVNRIVNRKLWGHIL